MCFWNGEKANSIAQIVWSALAGWDSKTMEWNSNFNKSEKARLLKKSKLCTPRIKNQHQTRINQHQEEDHHHPAQRRGTEGTSQPLGPWVSGRAVIIRDTPGHCHSPSPPSSRRGRKRSSSSYQVSTDHLEPAPPDFTPTISPQGEEELPHHPPSASVTDL